MNELYLSESSDSDILHEIKRRMKKPRPRKPATGVHIEVRGLNAVHVGRVYIPLGQTVVYDLPETVKLIMTAQAAPNWREQLG